MKRWTPDELGMIPDANGEYIRYDDHCEAMKRIAAEPPRQIVPDGSWYADQEKIAVTKEWILGWKACRDYVWQCSERFATSQPRQMVADRNAIYDAMVQFCDGNGVGVEPEVVDELAGAVSRFLQARAADHIVDAAGMVADSAQAEPVCRTPQDCNATQSCIGGCEDAAPAPSASPAPTDAQIIEIGRNALDMQPAEFVAKIRALFAGASPAALTERCQCCGYLVTESEHRGCLRAAQPPAAAEAERDAERYRFIKASMLILSGGHRKFGWPVSPFGEQCDRYLDAAMSASKEGA